MTQEPNKSPIEEYERRLTEQRNEAEDWIGTLALLWLVSQSMVLFLPCIGGEHLVGPDAKPAFVVLALMWFGSIVAAGAAAAAVVRYWRVLPGPWIACGLAPWLLVCAEAALVLLVALE